MLDEEVLRDLTHSDLPPGIDALSQEIRRMRNGVQAILLYGSCRREGQTREGLADLLVVVDSYRAVHGAGLTALANRLLPPNVYYLEVTTGQGLIRCKYAIVSADSFISRTRRGRDAYFWARFGQPCRLVWHLDDYTVQTVVKARCQALIRFARLASPLFPGSTAPTLFWTRALAASYRCELRPEPPDNARRLVERDQDFYRRISPLAVADLGWVTVSQDDLVIRPSRIRQILCRLDWFARRLWGKTLNLARLLKAAGTFTNGIDYLVWKVERHSGVRIEPTPRMRKYPRMAAWGIAWKLWRTGALR